jgi:drug/metabolite transporter (DMT)-like permease
MERMQDAIKANHGKAVFWLIAATAVWGLSFPIIKLLHVRHSMVDDTRVLSCWILVARCWFSALLLSLWRPSLLRNISRAEWLQSLGLILFGGAGLLFQADGLATTEASTSAFLTQFYCVLLPLWTCLRLRRRPSGKIVVCTLLVLVGMGVLSKLTFANLHLGAGEWRTIVAACFFTGQILVLEQPRYAANRGATITILALAGTGVFALCFAVPMTHDMAGMFTRWSSGPDLMLLAVLTFGCTLFSYLMMNQWQRFVSATEAGLIYCMEPVFTAVYVLFLPGMLGKFAGVTYENESITTALLIGGALVTLANIILQRK